MGTNYYAIPKWDEQLKKDVLQAINEERFHLAKRLIPEQIHIGKSSAGWQFCFNHHNWEHFPKSRVEFERFLNSCEIEDEYGRPISVSDFWEMVKNKMNQKKDYGETHFGLFFSNSTDFS